MDAPSFIEDKREFYPVSIQVDTAFQPDVFLEIQLPAPIPFKDGLFGIPDKRQEFLEHPAPQPPLLQEKRIVVIEEMRLIVIEELGRQPFYPRGDEFYVHPYPAVGADNGRGIVPAMRDGKMIAGSGQERLARIGDPYLLSGKIRE